MPGGIRQSKVKLWPVFGRVVLVVCLVLVLGGSVLPKNAQAAIGFVHSSASVSGASGMPGRATADLWPPFEAG